jgi:hypothetical protein
MYIDILFVNMCPNNCIRTYNLNKSVYIQCHIDIQSWSNEDLKVLRLHLAAEGDTDASLNGMYMFICKYIYIYIYVYIYVYIYLFI